MSIPTPPPPPPSKVFLWLLKVFVNEFKVIKGGGVGVSMKWQRPVISQAGNQLKTFKCRV